MENYRIITNIELHQCRANIWSPRHWLPSHHVEECVPEIKAAVAEFDKRAALKFEADVARLRQEREEARRRLIEQLRNGELPSA